MFKGSQIDGLVGLLQMRDVPLYHACQYQDFVSYLKLGGVPSRERLERAGLLFTRFTTDEVDRDNAVWDKVFANLEGYGQSFARGNAAVPNPYGPLVLRLHPSALLEADDVAICLRSAGARGFDRGRESLRRVSDVNRLFWKPLSEGHDLRRLKFKNGLRQEFGQFAQAVEVSCTCKNGLLSFAKLVDVVVDPYTIAGVPLTTWTQRAMADSGLKVPVKVRTPKVGTGIYDELVSLVGQRTPRLAELPNLTANVSLLDWAEQIRRGELEYQFRRFADYLREGTLRPVTALARKMPRPPYEAMPHSDDLYEEERSLRLREAYRAAEAWARAEEEGWFYAD